MHAKLMAQVFSEAIAAAQKPVIVNGAVYENHSRRITVTDELLSAMLYAMRELHCKQCRFGSYTCYDSTKVSGDVDYCLVGEINSLNSLGIKTTGCCCGHGKEAPYIQVTDASLDDMKALGYIKRPKDDYENGINCFMPKTTLPRKEEGNTCTTPQN